MPNQTTEQLSFPATPSAASCLHSRVIDDVLTKDGKRTGQVRCLECREVFEDPDQESK